MLLDGCGGSENGGTWGGGEIKAQAGLVKSGVNKKRVLAPPGELGGEPRLSGIRRDRSWVNRGHTDADRSCVGA